MTREEKERLLAEIENQYKWLMTKSPTIYMMDIAFDAIRKAVRDEASKEQLEPRWIPVSERLPEENETYEVTLQGVRELEGIDNEVAYATWLGNREDSRKLLYDYRDWLYHDVDDWKDKEVIAWKPLSMPYKAESEKEK